MALSRRSAEADAIEQAQARDTSGGDGGRPAARLREQLMRIFGRVPGSTGLPDGDTDPVGGDDASHHVTHPVSQPQRDEDSASDGSDDDARS